MPIAAFGTEKKALRAWARRQRAEFLSLDATVLDEVSTRLSDAFLALIAERSWLHIAVFIPLAGEPDIWTPAQQLMATQAANIYVPRMMKEKQLDLVMVTDPTALVRGPFGVVEPPLSWEALTDLTALDAIFIPGLAFCMDGGRLGFGGGWYDRLLARIPDKTIKIGVCWNELLIDSVPMDAWDIRMDRILTEAGYVTSS
ncbi:MAG: 5-formyltetrahydrofolate cyclo-ligase [Armatimonadaceae bacterium]